VSKHRYTGLVLSTEGNDTEDTFFDMMIAGETFRFVPTIDEEMVEDEQVLARIISVQAHASKIALLVTLKTVEVDGERMPAGIWILVFEGGLVCDRIPERPTDPDDIRLWIGKID